MSEFKNESVEQIVGWLEENRNEFTGRRAGQAWRAIALATADTFPEDRPAIYDSLLGKKKRIGSIVESGGATITRLTPKGGKQVVTSGCKDCPGGGTIISSGKEPRSVSLSGDEVIEETAEETEEKDLHSFASPEDVLERFDGDGEMMIAFADENGIDVGRAKKAETIAEKIYNHYE